jgi:hypothetical protein
MKLKWGLLGLLSVWLLLVSGCLAKQEQAKMLYTEDGRLIVRVSMYNNSTYPQWRAYVEESCPGIFIKWENNRNSTANVLYQARHNDLADIIGIRRFEADTSAQLEPYLADLSQLELTHTFEQQYLEPFSSGSKRCWLPAPGVFDGLVANTDLYARYGRELPRNWETFLDSCAFWQSHQVDGFAMDCQDPWTPVQMIQGFGMEEYDRLPHGKVWLQSFANNTASSVDPALFSAIAAKLRLLKQRGILTRDDLNMDGAQKDLRLLTSRAAIGRRTSDTFFGAAPTDHYAALPFFGRTEADNWLYTYPVFVLSLSQASQKDDLTRQAALKVLQVMLSERAQQMLNANCEGLISYNKDIRLQLTSSMKFVQPLIEQRKYFIRLLNSNSFQASSLALRALIGQDADNQQFIKVLNDNLFKVSPTKELGSSKLNASQFLDQNLCSASGSIIAQVLQEEMLTSCALMDVREAPCAIYKGPLTNKDLESIVLPGKIYRGSLTGAQLTRLLQDCIWSATTFAPGGIEPLLEYPVLAGIKVHLQRDGTILQVRKTDGQELEAEQIYTLTLSQNIYQALKNINRPLVQDFAAQELNLQQCFSNGLKKKNSLPWPQIYFTYSDAGAGL